MSRIKNRDTKPEMLVRKLCHSLGLRFRLYDKTLPGKPDLVFKKHKSVLFVHGCYWHMHKCKYGLVTPKTNAEKWRIKRERNTQRDKETRLKLIKMNWRVLVIWECETKDTELVKAKLIKYFSL